MQLDKLDRDLLFELGNDCRQPDSVIAKKLHSSKQVIRYRTKRLENEGIISDYNALIDFRVLGFNSIRMYFKLRNIDPVKEQEMFKEMQESDLFLWTVNLEGEIDLAFYMWVKELDHFYEKWEAFFQKYRRYVHHQEMYLSINMIHYPMKYLKMPDFVDVWNIGGNKARYKIDATDLKILQILSRHANMPLIDVAKEVNVSAKLVSYRIKQLEKKKIILAYNAILDEKKIGYHMYKVDFYLFDHSRLKEMYEYARYHPNIKNVMRTIGGPDFEIEPFVKNIQELRELIEDIRTKFSASIDHWRFNRIVKTIKQVYLPIEI